MGKRLDVSIPILNEKLKERNIQCLSPEYLGTLSKHKWLCLECGREWDATYYHINNRIQGCPLCGIIKRATTQRSEFNVNEINKKIFNRNIECLSNNVDYKNNKSKLKWQCFDCNKVWCASLYDVINSKHGCPMCKGKKIAKKLTLQIDFQKLNEELRETRKIKFSMEQMYSGVREKYQIECLVCGNIWMATYNNVMNNETGCSNLLCIGKKIGDSKRLDFDQIELNISLENKHIFFLPDQIYINANTKYFWGCKICENIWQATYGSIVYNERICPKCSIINRSGENHPMWRGGRKEYSSDWYTGEIQKFIRNRDNHLCQYPDCTYTDTGKIRALDVHHINGNKKDCLGRNLISLCNSHHITIERNDPRSWEEYFYQITESYEF